MIGCDALATPLVLQESAGAGLRVVAAPATSTFPCHSSTGAGPWVPGGWIRELFDFRCGYLESQSWSGAARGAPKTASPVWQVASTGLRPSQLNSAQRVTAARAPAASLAFA